MSEQTLVSAPYQLVDTPEQSIFRAYDIRGIVDVNLNENVAYSIGLAVGSTLQDRGVDGLVLGYDGRLSSPALASALQQGVLDSGINVTNIGLVPSPVLYFACNYLGVPSGLMVTGSHNPKEYNGIKLLFEGNTLTKEEIQDLYTRIKEKNVCAGHGELMSASVNDAYISTISAEISLSRRLKVVVDCGNASGGVIAPKLFEALGCDLIPLYCDIDGNFPNHHPDPSKEKNVAALKQRVIETGADIGIALDGDADRLGVVTNDAELIWPDRQLMLYARDILKRNPGSTVVYDVKCSMHLQSEVEKYGGVAVMCPTGHSIVKAKMKETQALLAGEMSGHLFFKERWYGFDDGLYSACRLLEILADQSLSSSELFATVPDSISTPELTIPMADELKFDFMQQLLAQTTFDDAKLVTIDGLRVEFIDGWGLIRASNTTPCLVARFEAETVEALQRIQAIFKTQLLALRADLLLPF